MGCWAIPSRSSAVGALRALLGSEMSAADAGKRLYNVFGDDELFDAIAAARKIAPACDVRTIVAVRLGELVYLTKDARWELEDEVRSEIKELVQDVISKMEPDDVVLKIGTPLTQESATRMVAAVVGQQDTSAFVALGSMLPGGYAVMTDKEIVYHVSHLGGIVREVPEDRRSEYDQAVEDKYARESASDATMGW